MNGLPAKKVHKNPEYLMDKFATVTSAANYRTNRTIDVMFLDHGKAFPVWCVGDISREPVEGDMVVVGFLEGRKDSPYIKGFIKLNSVTANYIDVGKDYIRIQLPQNDDDAEEHMTDDSKKNTRVYLEINNSGIALYHPSGNIYLNTPKGNVQTITKTGTQTF